MSYLTIAGLMDGEELLPKELLDCCWLGFLRLEFLRSPAGVRDSAVGVPLSLLLPTLENVSCW